MGFFTKGTKEKNTMSVLRIEAMSDKKFKKGDAVFLTNVCGMKVKYVVTSKRIELKDPWQDRSLYASWKITYGLKWFRNVETETVYRHEEELEKA